MTQQYIAPSRDNANTCQISNLVGVIQMLSSLLFTTEDGDCRIRDEATRSAIEVSVIDACQRLNVILGDSDRWSLKDFDSVTDMYKENTNLIKLQQALTREAGTPHARYKPQIVKIGSGEWMAFCGDPTNLDSAIIGLGVCPADAVEAFDQMFKGITPEKLKQFLAQHENPNPVDTGRNENPEEPKKQRHPRRRNSGNPETPPEVDNG